MLHAFRTQTIRKAVNGQATADELTPVERELARRQWEIDNPDEVSTQRPAGLPVHPALGGDGRLSTTEHTAGGNGDDVASYEVADRARELLTGLVKR